MRSQQEVLLRLDEELTQKIARLQDEVAELEAASRVIRRLITKNGTVPKFNTKPQTNPCINGEDDGGRKTVREWIFEILLEKKALHYKKIAEEAVRRGYRSDRSSDPGAPHRTFTSFLYRHKDLFYQPRMGVFSLRNTEDESRDE